MAGCASMAYQEKQLQEISKKFQIYGEILHAETLKIGHINETYTATYDQGGTRVRYIHQKINRNVFKNPSAVMKNVMRVTTHNILHHRRRIFKYVPVDLLMDVPNAGPALVVGGGIGFIDVADFQRLGMED